MSQEETASLNPSSEPSESAPDRIGPYQILEQLGHGGMGTVYLAEQKQPVRRRVAIKVIKLGRKSQPMKLQGPEYEGVE